MPRMEMRELEKKMAEVARTIPKHIQKSLYEQLDKLSTDETIIITVPIEIEVSCMWDNGNAPTLNFCEVNESVEDLDDATDEELKKLGLSSVIKLRDKIQKEITEWNTEIARLEKAYSLEEDLLADFLIGGHYGSK